jgi:uncharacterized protein
LEKNIKNIWIRIGTLEFSARLNDTRTAGLVWDALPITASFNFWGDEIYFPIPVQETRMENPRETVDLGDLGFWPEGNCFCIFYGLTPISGPGEIKPASAVEVIGRVKDYEGLKKIQAAGMIVVERYTV